MRKKLTLLLLALIICTQLTACSADNIPLFGNVLATARNILTGLQTTELKNTAAEDNLFPMSKKTKDAQTKALDMSDKAAYWSEVSSKHTNAWSPIGWIARGMEKKRGTDAANALNKYETAKAKDEIWLKARESAGKTGAKTTFKWSHYGLLIGIAICILLLFLWRLWCNLKRKSKAEAKAIKKHAKAELKAAKHADTVIFEQPAATQATLVGRNEEKSIAQCKKYCDKFGIDYETMLAQYGGNPQQLLDVLVTSRKEDFQ